MLHEPLVHFLTAGLVLFGGYQLLNPSAGDDVGRHDIRVDEQSLLRFAKFRTRSFDDGRARAYLASLSPGELSRMVGEYVQEEALYREALAWGLDKQDYVIRRRMVQSLEYAARDASTPDKPLSEAELRHYYDSHKDLYSAPPNLSFAHVYFSGGGRGRGEARRLARDALPKLNFTGDRGEGLGDRFLYQQYYVDQNPDVIRSHFGSPMAKALFKLNADPQRWHGPFESPYGVHLVRVTRRSEGGAQRFAEVRSLVERDAAEELLERRQQTAIDRIVARYRVHVSGGLPDPEGARQ